MHFLQHAQAPVGMQCLEEGRPRWGSDLSVSGKLKPISTAFVPAQNATDTQAYQITVRQFGAVAAAAHIVERQCQG